MSVIRYLLDENVVPLFRTELAGPCRAAARAWDLPPETEIEWRAVLVNRPAPEVRQVLQKFHAVRLLIVNTPEDAIRCFYSTGMDALVIGDCVLVKEPRRTS